MKRIINFIEKLEVLIIYIAVVIFLGLIILNFITIAVNLMFNIDLSYGYHKTVSDCFIYLKKLLGIGIIVTIVYIIFLALDFIKSKFIDRDLF